MDITITTNTTNSPLNRRVFCNGVLKRHDPHKHHHVAAAAAATGGSVFYKECLKNHAATIGSHAVDGCGEFMPSPTATFTDPTSIRCAACGCHRNFHRCESNAALVVEYTPQRRYYPLPLPAAYLQAQVEACQVSKNNHHHCVDNNPTGFVAVNLPSPKRFRTKFSQEQKEKMLEFAAKVGWKIHKRNEELICGFCNEIGVQTGVFKVWMHNNKNTTEGMVKRFGNSNNENSANQGVIDVNHKNNINNNNDMEEDEEHVNGNGIGIENSHSSTINSSHTNASSSSS